MASVMATTTMPPCAPEKGHTYGEFERFVEAAACDRFKEHELVETMKLKGTTDGVKTLSEI